MHRIILLLVFLLLQAPAISGTPVTGFNANYKNGQVFCTWNNLPTTGVTYHLYKSGSPILFGYQLASCEYLGSVYDSSSYNKHLSQVKLIPCYLKIDSASAPLDISTGLFVATTEQDGNFYYALTTVSNGMEDTSIEAGINSLITPLQETVSRPLPVFQTNSIMNTHVASIYVIYASSSASVFFPQMVNTGSYPFNFSVNRNGSDPHPLTIRLAGGGSDFLSGIFSNIAPDEYRIGMDDWLPNDERSSWFGYNEQYDIFSHNNAPPVSGINHDYALQRIEFVIDWAIRSLPVDSNRIYFSGISSGASGSFFASLSYPGRIAAASMNVPKFDLSFLHDPDTTNNYNEGMPGRLRFDTLCGTVPVNLLTNTGVLTYDLLNGGWLAHQHKDDVPLLFAVNGKRDTMVGWAEKIPYYDSVNTNRLGGAYFWDLRKHSGEGGHWKFSPDLFRYHRNVSFPAFSNCSVNNDPGDGHLESGDSVGTINGFLDWNDSISDDSAKYKIAVFMTDPPTYYGNIAAPDSCFTDITLRRLQHFQVPANAVIFWNITHNGLVIQQDSFSYTGGLITLSKVKIFKDTSIVCVTFGIASSSGTMEEHEAFFLKIFPNPAGDMITIDAHQSEPSGNISITDLAGKLMMSSIVLGDHVTYVHQVIDVHSLPPGCYLVTAGRNKSVIVKQ